MNDNNIKSIFKALIYGRINPWDRRIIHSSERKEIEQKIEAEKGYFIERMSPDDYKRFEALESLYFQVSVDEDIDIFTHGFTMGVLIMQAVSAKQEDIT